MLLKLFKHPKMILFEDWIFLQNVQCYIEKYKYYKNISLFMNNIPINNILILYCLYNI